MTVRIAWSMLLAASLGIIGLGVYIFVVYYDDYHAGIFGILLVVSGLFIAINMAYNLLAPKRNSCPVAAQNKNTP